MALVIVMCLLWYSFPLFEFFAKGILVLITLVICVEWVLLFYIKNKITITRQMTNKLSLSDVQPVKYQIENRSKWKIRYEMIDELPFQLQERDLIYHDVISSDETTSYTFDVRPLIRGRYEFGSIHLYISMLVPGLIQRRISFPLNKSVEVYPSFIQMKYYDLQVFSRVAAMTGIRAVRRIGTNDEFEHIKSYTQGDTPRTINWKATSRSNDIMVNQYQDTQSQNIYCVIDMGRSMRMPFEGLSLLDYAINSSLVLSNIVLKKYDRAGIITFAEEVKTVVRADTHRHQIKKITKALYDQKTGFKEPSYERLYYLIRRGINRRSVMIFFSNFEHLDDLSRQLPYLEAINKKHLMVVVFFLNTGLIEASEMECSNADEIYLKTFAQKAIMEKHKIRKELSARHIQTILTRPSDLSTQVINKYLEIKAKRMN